MAQRSVPAPFLTKTYQLVDDPSTDDVISWSESGNTFVVWKTADFAKICFLITSSTTISQASSASSIHMYVTSLPPFVPYVSLFYFSLIGLRLAGEKPRGKKENEKGTGFRKIVPDKWEFANEYFKRGQRELMSEIRRRKTTTSSTAQVPPGGKSAGGGTSSPTNSGEDLGSTSTSSPDSKNPGSVETTTTAQFADLSDENEKLKKDNESLSTELAQTKSSARS
ncbi:Heat shock factor protein HSF24 [Vitis vinifera]|uniref:Heat shock factor protein HSF24 n=1 Tax=Vitis vinifera TaxID=29760 RepID=A0A438F5T1_VITVI|nr:Heat shock factor protein HSF24 [Vitis vinifera]